MGSVGNFLFGGGDSNQTGSNSSNSSSNSSNQAQNTGVQASQSTSNQSSGNASGSRNQAYGELNAALMPTLGYTANAGNMMGALLGLPASNFKYTAAAPAVMPPMPVRAATLASGTNIVDQLLAKYLASAQAAPPPAPAPVPAPVPTPTPVPAPVTGGSGSGTGSGGIVHPLPYSTAGAGVQYRAMGGPVQAGKPYVVGENRPEMFVPNQSGTILPQVPGSVPPIGMGDLAGRGGGGRGGGPGGYPGPRPIPGGGGHPGPGGPPIPAPGGGAPPPVGPPITAPPLTPASALDTFANSAGMNFILDQGQKALSGASAANGTFNSGATGKALTQYGQNLGSTYLNQYMDQLMNYGKLGLGSASALSGAGGVSQSVGSSSGGSNSSSFGSNQGSSSGTSTGLGSSSGSTSGSSNTKNGLLPALGSIGL